MSTVHCTICNYDKVSDYRVVKHLLKKKEQTIALKHYFVQNDGGLANDCTEALNEELIVGLGVAKTVCTLPNGSHSRQRRAQVWRGRAIVTRMVYRHLVAIGQQQNQPHPNSDLNSGWCAHCTWYTVSTVPGAVVLSLVSASHNKRCR